MTLDELSSLARRAYVTSESSNVLDGWRATVLAVLDAVERNCVPTQMIPATDYWDEGYNKSRDEMLDAIQTLRGGDDHDVKDATVLNETEMVVRKRPGGWLAFYWTPGMRWQPIETAPKDNARPLLLAYFNEQGELTSLDFDGSWERGQESWEMPKPYWYWGSCNGIEEPTHWAYEPEGFRTAPKRGEK